MAGGAVSQSLIVCGCYICSDPLPVTLMEVVGSRGQIRKAERLYRSDIDRRLSAFRDLHATTGEEEGLARDDELELMKGLSRDEEIGDAVFIFERDEAVAFSELRWGFLSVRRPHAAG